MITPALFIDAVFQLEQVVTVPDSLHGRLCIVKRFSFRNSINKVPSYMRPAGAALDAGNFVVTLIAICFQISMKTL